MKINPVRLVPHLLWGVLCLSFQAHAQQTQRPQVEMKRQGVTSTPQDAWLEPDVKPESLPEGLKGQIVYPNRVPVTGGPQRQPFDLVLRAVGKEIKRGAAPSAVYRVTPPMAEVVFDPQFSSDGHLLLFKVGWPFEKFSTYRVFFWDLVNQELLTGPKDNIANQNLAWSLDGRFLAYIVGGDYEGNIWNDKDSLRLCIYDRQTEQSRTVASNSGVTSFTWTPQNTLLFLSFSPEAITQSAEAIRKHGRQPTIAQRPQLMEAAASGGQAKSVASGAYGNLYYSPMPPMSASPDGKWIAFYGWPEPKPAVGGAQTPKKKPGDPEEIEYAGLYLLDRATNKRFFVYRFSAQTQDFLTWTPDGKRLILTRTSYDEVNNRGKGEAKIIVVDAPSPAPAPKVLATLHVEDYEPVYHRSTEPPFEPLRTSKDGHYLVIKSWQAKAPQSGIDRRMTYPVLNLVQAIDLTQGTAVTIAQTIDRQSSSNGLDWSD